MKIAGVCLNSCLFILSRFLTVPQFCDKILASSTSFLLLLAAVSSSFVSGAQHDHPSLILNKNHFLMFLVLFVKDEVPCVLGQANINCIYSLLSDESSIV